MSIRFGVRLGRSGFLSAGRSGLRIGGRIGPARISTGRSGTRLGAGRGGVFVSRWYPASRTRRRAQRTPTEPS